MEGYAGFLIVCAHDCCDSAGLIRDEQVSLDELLTAIGAQSPIDEVACHIAREIIKAHHLTSVSMNA